MKRKIIAAAAITAILALSSCGAVGRPDPTTITRKDQQRYNSDTESFDDSSDTDESALDPDSSADESSSTKEKSEEEIEKEKKEKEKQEKIEKAVNSTMKDMTVEEKVGQLFIVRADALESDFSADTVNDDDAAGVTFVDDIMKQSIDKYHVGGVVVYEKNVESKDQLKSLIKDLQKESDITLFVGVDEEGGRTSTLASNEDLKLKTFESMAAVGKTEDTDQAKKVGTTIGTYLSDLGFNLNFAPVADVYSNAENQIIGDRSFSSKPEIVSKMVTAEIKGLHSKNIMTAVKHYPGFGDVSGGMNGVMASTSKNWVELMECDMIPFTEAIKQTDMIMAGHITAPKATKDGMPASMSKELISDKLRGELGYNGVVITDSMADASITASFNSGESAVRAISAGVDIVLTPYDLDSAYNAVLEAVNSGTISEERLDESIQRILTLKAEYGLIG